MKQGVPLGGQIKAVAHLLERRTNQQLALAGAGDITPMHGMVLAFLCRRPEQALYQKDVENYFSISPSTATCMLKMMEQKGYLRREPVSHDARLKRLVCTPEGEQLFCSINTAVQGVEADLLGCLGNEAYDQLWEGLEKLRRSLDAPTSCRCENPPSEKTKKKTEEEILC